MGYIFISYSHKDNKYVHRLGKDLEKAGFDVWVDDRIDYGSEWPNEIQQRVDNCDAFILLMSSNSFASKWVQNELHRAVRKEKPMFPLLLEGDEPWLSVESTQIFDVTDGRMPDKKLYNSLNQILHSQKHDNKISLEGIPYSDQSREVSTINSTQQINQKRRISKVILEGLVRRHNDDFCKVMKNRDIRYLKGTTTEKGFNQAKQNVVELLDYFQDNNIQSSSLIDIKLLDRQIICDNLVRATIDEVWEEKYIDGRITRLTSRNIYQIIFANKTWLIDSCEILSPT
jgi:hypothetical protein